ncbi:MAG: DUF1585 domain-containing protein [Proteobacteria bacterium]|nr:DUF1585 domain-containing protein [Pseudomonadota bacterium]MCP4917296.1 DUF1585 domain-containing protein [Pseudomonadota bacterium]
MIWLVLACAKAPEETGSLAAPRLLRRASLDLRGTLPSVEELDAVEEDPTRIDAYVTQWLDEETLEDVLVQRLAERWHTRVDVFPIEYQDYVLAPEQEYMFERSVGEEPLRLVANIVAEDRSWDEVVLADHSMANSMLLDIWPVSSESADATDTDWVKSSYTDGRPSAGVLTTNGLWWRYETTVSNLNRGRIAAVTRILLCEDYLDRPVSFADRDVDADPALAVLEDPACQACHSSLDPAAGSLMGFWWVVQYSEPEFAYYHPERERLWEDYLTVAPAWHGEPISGPGDLGVQISRDPRFHACAVSSFASSYWRREATWEDEVELAELREVFTQADHRVKPLLAAIVGSESYAADDPRLLAPYQLETAVEELTGLRWEEDGVRMLDEDPAGVRVLAGGVDGHAARSPQQAPGLTRTLVLKRVAEMAAVSGDALADEDLETLYWHLLAERPTESDLAELQALEDAVSELDPDQARAAVLSALLRDPGFVVY